MLQPVSANAAKRYRERGESLTDYVNRCLGQRSDIHTLFGGNSLSVMYSNHEHHHAFMAEVFAFNKPQMLFDMVPWVYAAYAGQGVSYAYFLCEFEAWIEAAHHVIPEVEEEILPYYRWFQDQHEHMVEQSQCLTFVGPGVGRAFENDFDGFLAALLQGDARESLRIGNRFVHDGASMVSFYIEMIQPALYRVGELWQKGEISVAQEHLASGVVNRAMAYWYIHVLNAERTRGKVVVSAAANEFHAIGGHMVADLLAIDGWEVIHLGANTPANELAGLVEVFEPHLVALSVCMPFNLSAAQEMIRLVHEHSANKDVKVMVGGQAFNLGEDLWCAVGADGWGADGYKAVELARSWHDHP